MTDKKNNSTFATGQKHKLDSTNTLILKFKRENKSLRLSKRQQGQIYPNFTGFTGQVS